jgi:hypothetical protein
MKSPGFVTHTEQTIQLHNQSPCEVRSNLTIKSKPNKSLDMNIANEIASFLAKTKTRTGSAKFPDFATHVEQAIQVHNQSLCEARSNLTIKENPTNH